MEMDTKIKVVGSALGRATSHIPGVSAIAEHTVNKTVIKSSLVDLPGRVMSMVKTAAGRGSDDLPEIPANLTDDKARFTHAAASSGNGSKAALAALEARFVGQFWLIAIPAVLAVGLIIIQSGRLPTWGSLPSLICGVALFCMLAPMAFKSAFMSWQLRTRSLGSVRQFLKSWDWIPSPVEKPIVVKKSTKNRVAAMFVVGVIGVSSLIGTAYAQPNPTQLTASSLMQSGQNPSGPTAALLSAITGASGTGGTASILTLMSGTGSPITYSLGVLCSALFLLGSMMLAYQTIEGMVLGAMKGEFFGKHHTWFSMPRIVIGVGSLAPIFPNGLAGVHIIVLLVASLSSTIANDAYSAFISQVIVNGSSPSGALQAFIATLAPASATPGSSVAAATMPVPTADMAQQILDLEICYAGGVQVTADQNKSWPGNLTPLMVTGAAQPVIAGVPDAAGTSTVWSYGACGSITFPNSVVSNQLTATGASQMDPAVVTFVQARVTAMGTLISAVRSSGLPTQVITAFGISTGSNKASFPTSVVTPLVSAITAYDTTMTQAGATMLLNVKGSQTTKLLAASKQIGWIGAGLVYRPLFDASAAASSQAHIMPSIALGKTTSSSAGLAFIQAATDRTTADWSAQTKLAGIDATDFTATGNAADNLLMRNLDKLSQSITQAVLQSNASLLGGSDPIATLVSLGNSLIYGAEAIIVAGLALAAGLGNLFSSAVGGAAAWSWASVWLAAAIAWMLGLGITLAFVLPIMPFMAVFWAVVAWISAICELMIGLPCWAFSMMRMEGENFIGQHQTAGIAALTSLLLRPTVVVCAFGFTYIVLPLELGLFNALFPVAFVAQQGGHITGIVAILAALTISTKAQWQIVQMSMRAITTWPDQIAHFWGGRAEGRGEHQNSTNAMTTAFGAGAAVGGVVTGGVENAQGIAKAREKAAEDAAKLKAAQAASADADQS
jgi:conjugal transfer/type IV secretion protein DotA/TraY